LTQNLCSKRLNQESGAFVADFGSEKGKKIRAFYVAQQ
jgi:hypothetical protein